MLTFFGKRARADEPGMVRFSDNRPGGSSEIVVNEGGSSFRWGHACDGARSLCEALIFMSVVALPAMTASRARAIARANASAVMWAWAVDVHDHEWTVTADEMLIVLNTIGATRRHMAPTGEDPLGEITAGMVEARMAKMHGNAVPLFGAALGGVVRMTLEALRAIMRDRDLTIATLDAVPPAARVEASAGAEGA